MQLVKMLSWCLYSEDILTLYIDTLYGTFYKQGCPLRSSEVHGSAFCDFETRVTLKCSAHFD